MDSKEETLKSFLKILKVSFKNASIYQKEHPALVDSIQELKVKIDDLFSYLSPLNIGFTPHSLRIEGKYLEKEKISEDLADFFHHRKVKSIAITKGVTFEELMAFILSLSNSPKNILLDGGIEKILLDTKLANIKVKELDYTPLLKGEGEEVSDVWTYLLQEALETKDKLKINEVANNFENAIDSFTLKDIDENESLRKNISDLFSYLKENVQENYKKCGTDLIKSVVKRKNISSESKLENLKILISDLPEEDLGSTLFEEIVSNDKFDSMSLSIFSRLFDKEKHNNIAASLSEHFNTHEETKTNPKIQGKIKDILTGHESLFVSEIYRQTLTALLQDLSFRRELSFDRNLLQKNYCLILLNMLAKETDANQLTFYCEKLLDKWDSLIGEADFDFLKSLLEILEEKKESLASQHAFVQVNTLIVEKVENSLLNGLTVPNLEYFLSKFERSTLDVNTYLDKIFVENRITPDILQVFFKFFKEYLFYFNLNLEEKTNDITFLEKLTDCLESIDSPISLVTLKNIFSLGKNHLKIHVLKAMQRLPECDENFLLSELKKGDYAVRKQILLILKRNVKSLDMALDMLFRISSPFGIRNKILSEHIRIVDEINLFAAKGHLIPLKEKRFFWNKKLKEKASKVLRKWDDQQS